MSGYDEATRSLETEQQRQKGSEAYLSQEERDQVQRILKYPEEFPRDFGSWIQDYLSVNVPQIPISNVVGFERFQTGLEEAQQDIIDNQVTAATASVATSQGTTSGSFTDLATAGPTLTGLSNGLYVVQFGGAMWNTGGGGNGAESSVSVNGAAATNADQISCYGITQPISLSRSIFKTLSGGNNTLQMKYKIANGGTAFFGGRWILALKIGA